MRNNMLRTILSALLVMMACGTVSAQKTMSVSEFQKASYKQKMKHNPYSVNSQKKTYHSYGLFYAEYNPHSWHFDNGITGETTSGYHGVSVGFNYFVPFAGPLGFDAGLKTQYLFRRKTELGVKNNFEMLSLTVPIDLALDLRATRWLTVYPYAGLYGRYNLTASSKKGTDEKLITYNWFKEGNPDGEMNRFQMGWQVGVNFRFNETFAVGGGYWMDFGEVTDHKKLYGFNVTLGAVF